MSSVLFTFKNFVQEKDNLWSRLFFQSKILDKQHSLIITLVLPDLKILERKFY